MFKKISLSLMAAMCFWACSDAQKAFKKTPSGLQYKMHVDKPGNPAKEGDVIEFNFVMKTDKDSVLNNSFDRGAVISPLMKSPFKGSLEEGLALLSSGDSATFLINADSLFEKAIQQPLPPFIKKGSFLTFVVKMEKAMTMEEYQKEAALKAEKMIAEQDGKLQDYMKANGLTATKTASGLYYANTKKGTGAKPENGKTVVVHYTGKLLNGTKFDSSVDRGQPFEFVIGQGQVIRGWDEGIALMNIGDKGVLLIPSELAYGERGAGGSIPPNSPLIFEVELINIK